MKKVLTLILLFIFFSSLCSCKDSNYDNNQQNLFDSIVEEETEDIIKFYLPSAGNWSGMGYWRAYFKTQSKLYHYDFFCINGCVTVEPYMKKYYREIIDYSMPKEVLWGCNIDQPTGGFEGSNPKKDYLTIIQKYNDNITGYVIFEFIQDDDVYWAYYCTLIKSVYFPKLNDDYQSVPKEYVFKKLEEVKDEI